MPRLRSLVCAISLSFLSPAPAILAQPAEQPVRQPPAWPTAQEYFENRDRVGETPAPATQQAEEAPASRAADLPPFTVQLAAFRKYPLAQAFAGALPADDVMVLGSLRGGQDWFVVILGLYATRLDAALAEAEYRRRYPSATTWLRGTRSLRRLKDSGG